MPHGAMPRPSYLAADPSIWSWLTTTDHKRIGVLYLVALVGFFLVGSIAAALFRLELATPEADVVSADVYNRLFTAHGVVMVWFFLIPSIPAVLGNFLLPLMLGADDLPFPRLNLASWYVFVAGGLLSLGSILFGGVDTGWTFYTPYSSTYSNSYVMLMAAGVFVAGFASIFTGINFLVAIHRLRAPGMGWFRMPLFAWSLYATSLINVLATPVLATTLVLMVLERLFSVGVFDPDLGGDPVLFQHLFWFYSHPAVYIMILPGMGVVSEVLSCFARKRVFGYTFIAFSSLAIALLGFLVWGHHMFTTSQSVVGSLVFSLLSLLVAVPSAVKVFNWTATLWRGSIALDTPMLYVLGFLVLFTVGGLTGVMLSVLPIDVHVHDTYFVVAHFHFIMVGGMVLACLGGLHFWWPKITGRMYPERLGRIAAVAGLVGFVITFTPQFVAGYMGMPRRYHEYPDEFALPQAVSSAGVVVLAIGYVLPFGYLLWSLPHGRPAGANPWCATGLEWTTPSPPPADNFATTPHVTEEAYAYRADED